MKSNAQAVLLYQNPVKLAALLGVSLVLGACGSSQQPSGSAARIQTQSLNSITPVIANEEYVIRNQCGGKILDVDGVSMADGARVQTYSYVGTKNQDWTVIPTDSGYYKIIAKHSGKALDVSGQGTVDGTNIQQYPYYGGNSQQWMFTDAGNGYYKLTPRNAPTKALDVVNANVNDGASVDIYQDNGSCAQHWKLETFASLATYSAPITITAGGTYTGNWKSTDPNVPAVSVKTTAPVTIQNCLIQSAGTLINADQPPYGSNVTIQNCRGYALNPNNTAKSAGRFFNSLSVGSLRIVNNYMAGTSGILVNTLATSTNAITIQNNRVRNVDGRLSDGNNGWSTANPNVANFVLFNNVNQASNADISWNEVINQPYFSRSEDNINMYNSSGTASSPIMIHDNYIQGAYQTDPMSNYYSGGGILLGDTDSNQTNPANVGYTRASYNQVVGTTNYGIGIVGGVYNEVDHNRIVSSGLFSDGTPIPANNTGYMVWDYYNLGGKTPPVFANNYMHDNAVGWIHRTSGPAYQQNQYTPSKTLNGTRAEDSSFTNIPNPTLADEAAEYQSWLSKLSSNSKVLGTN